MSRTPLLQQSDPRRQKQIKQDESSQNDDEGFLRKSQFNKSIYDEKGSQLSRDESNLRLQNNDKYADLIDENTENDATNNLTLNPENFEVPKYDPKEQEDNEEDQKILILKEPSGCKNIPTIEQEKNDLQGGMPKKPVETYLDNCRNFAETNLRNRCINIPSYIFSRKDFDNQVINNLLIDQILKDGGRIESELIQDDQIQGCFQTDEGMRIFLDFIYYNQKQHLLVKTWQKVYITQPKPRERKKYAEMIRNKNNLEKQTTQKKKKVETAQKSIDENKLESQFYIKTLQVLTKQGVSLFDPILVEQVFGKFDDYRVYDTSTLYRDGKIYYFKRKYINGNDQQEIQSQKDSSDVFEIIDTLNNQEDQVKQKQKIIYKQLCKQKQQLMLHSYDIKLQRETPFPNVLIDEDDNNQEYQKKLQYIIQTGRKMHLNDYKILKPQYMVTMSQEFGPHLNFEYKKEESQKEQNWQWLKDQFFSIQRYTQKQEANPFKIIKIDDYIKNSIQNFVIASIDCKNKPDENECTRQIQFLNHIRDYDKKEQENKTISFLITNMKALVQIQYNDKTKKLIDPQKYQIFKRKSSDIFTKIFNNGGVIAQMARIKQKDQGGFSEDFDQYFYVDSRNQIQLLYPQIEQKIQKLKTIDIIAKNNKIIPKDYSFYKVIISISQQNEKQINYKNTIQKFENLRQIINYEDINCRQSITYLKDSDTEKLYITEPSTSKILIFYLENSNQIQCKLIDEENMKKGGKNGEKEKETETNFNMKITNKNKEQPTTQTGFDHEEPYLMYKQNSNTKQSKKGQMVILDEKERRNHVLIDDFNGNKMKVKTYDITNNLIDEQQQLRLILYQQSQGGEFCFFLFVVQNTLQLGGSNDAFSDTRIIKKNYIFVRKNHAQMKNIFQSMCKEVIIHPEDKILIMKNNLVFDLICFCDIREFQFRKEFGERDLEKIVPTEKNKEVLVKIKFQTPYIETKIVLSKAADDKCRINFVPMVYQEKQSNLTLKLLLFDIIKFKVTQTTSIGPAKYNQDYMYEDEQGYKKFWLCRTSDLHEEYQNQVILDSLTQRTKYQLFTLYQEKIGRIMGEEFLITFQKQGSVLQTIGQKHIILSQDIIQECEWTNIRDSSVIPFYDDYGSIKGCQFMLKTNTHTFSQIQLCDQDMNNLYGYKSKILVTGKKQFQIQKKQDREQFVVIISALMRRSVITKNIFDRQEAFQILERGLNLMLSMRVPDLEFLVQNTFEDLKKQDFFQSQEILLGKSICDICISDPDSIHYAIKYFDCINGTYNSSGSIIEKILQQDFVRKQAFIQTKFYPKQMIIQIDLNQVGTIKRALFYSNIKSLKILLNQCFQIIDQFDYQPIIMFDLGSIIESSQVQINDFFNISKTEKKDAEVYGFCNLEIEFKNPDLPVFHDKPFDFFIMHQFENFLQSGRDILRDIQYYNDQTKGEKTHEIEYYYIDFSSMHIGEKIRNIDSDKPMKFDDLYYSRLIKIKCDQGEASSSFFAQETIQKIIDSQWILTKHVQKQIFMVYFLLYCVPMSISSFKITTFVDNLMFKIALIPASMLGFIEFVQLLEQKWQYFQGWNVIDSMQIFIYGLLFYMLLTDNTEVLFFPELKLINIILAFMKILFFIRIYEKFGFLVQMIISCIVALVPFIMAFLVFVLVFSVCYVVLELELGMDESEAKALPFFCKMVLQTFKNSIGELMMPKYTLISAKEESFFKNVNILLIWIVWIMHTFFQLVIMLNFLIAVISSNYEESMGLQVLIGYQQKAELNYETYMLINVFKKLNEYKCLVLQCSKSGEELIKDNIGEKFDSMKKYIQKENKRILGDYSKLNDSMDHISKIQNKIESTIFQKFLNLQNSLIHTKEEVIKQINNQMANINNPHGHGHGHGHK